VLPVGIEPIQESSEKSEFFKELYAKVYAFPELILIIQQWKSLTEGERQSVLELIKNRP
jgi:hypothetical protein